MQTQTGCRRFFLRGSALHPLWRVIIYLIALLVAEIILDLVIDILYGIALALMGASAAEVLDALAAGGIPGPLLLAIGVSRLAIALGLALLMGHFLEREPVETLGLDPTHLGKDTAVGLLLGAGTMILIGATLLALNPQSPWPGRAVWWAFSWTPWRSSRPRRPKRWPSGATSSAPSPPGAARSSEYWSPPSSSPCSMP